MTSVSTYGALGRNATKAASIAHHPRPGRRSSRNRGTARAAGIAARKRFHAIQTGTAPA
jgi:hypothetical protein